ncbi:MAG: hypothetical protein AAB075_02975 [Gemmatimonadota bacterium]
MRRRRDVLPVLLLLLAMPASGGKVVSAELKQQGFTFNLKRQP